MNEPIVVFHAKYYKTFSDEEKLSLEVLKKYFSMRAVIVPQPSNDPYSDDKNKRYSVEYIKEINLDFSMVRRIRRFEIEKYKIELVNNAAIQDPRQKDMIYWHLTQLTKFGWRFKQATSRTALNLQADHAEEIVNSRLSMFQDNSLEGGG